MAFIFFLLACLAALLFLGQPLADWWNQRALREQEIAELEAAERHTRPVLIRSRYIGDPDVEEAFERLRNNIRRAGSGCFIKPEDVYMAIYRTRSKDGNAFIDFQDWVDLVEAEHRRRVLAWEAAQETTMNTDKGRVGLNDQGKRVMNGQKQPTKREYIFDFSTTKR